MKSKNFSQNKIKCFFASNALKTWYKMCHCHKSINYFRIASKTLESDKSVIKSKEIDCQGRPGMQ